LADISGYTSFVAQTEIEHADLALSYLLETIVEKISSLLTICQLEGDAVFAYIEENNLQEAQSLLELEISFLSKVLSTIGRLLLLFFGILTALTTAGFIGLLFMDQLQKGIERFPQRGIAANGIVVVRLVIIGGILVVGLLPSVKAIKYAYRPPAMGWRYLTVGGGLLLMIVLCLYLYAQMIFA
jgi:hypothetical protein